MCSVALRCSRSYFIILFINGHGSCLLGGSKKVLHLKTYRAFDALLLMIMHDASIPCTTAAILVSSRQQHDSISHHHNL